MHGISVGWQGGAVCLMAFWHITGNSEIISTYQNEVNRPGFFDSVIASSQEK